jgi:hypothetical protein
MVKKFYMGESKPGSIEAAIQDVWKNAAENNMSGEKSFETGTDRYRQHTQDLTPGQQTEEVVVETNKNDKSDDGEGLDAVQPKAVKKKFDDRKDKDIDNDGDTDDSDEFLHKKRKAISKSIDKKENVKEGVSNLRDTIINMWTEASSAVNPNEREELDKAPEKTAKKMKQAEKPAPMVATEEVDLDEAKAEKDEGNAFSMALKAAKEKGEKTFVVAGKKYDVQEELSLENAQQFKVASMKEALAKVWGFSEAKSPEQQDAIAISKKEKSKNAKADTGGKMAEVEIDPKLEK